MMNWALFVYREPVYILSIFATAQDIIIITAQLCPFSNSNYSNIRDWTDACV